MKKNTIIYGLIVIIILSSIFLISEKKKNDKIVSVKTAIAEVGELNYYISTSATLKSKSIKEYYGPQSKIKKVYVRVGDKVKIGETLISYETQDLATPVSQSLAKNKSTIIADNAGVVTDLNAIEGSVGNEMEPVVIVQNLGNLKGVVSLGKYDASKVKVGQYVIIKNGEATYRGRISFIDPEAKVTVAANGGEPTIDVDIDILDRAPDLKIGFDVDVEIIVGKVTNIIKIPSQGLNVEKGEKNSVYVVVDNIVHKREVNIGTKSNTEVQITKGIKSGERIILSPSTSIKEGIIVKEVRATK